MGEKKGRGFYRKMGRGAQSKVPSKTRKDSTFVYILVVHIKDTKIVPTAALFSAKHIKVRVRGMPLP